MEVLRWTSHEGHGGHVGEGDAGGDVRSVDEPLGREGGLVPGQYADVELVVALGVPEQQVHPVLLLKSKYQQYVRDCLSSRESSRRGSPEWR